MSVLSNKKIHFSHFTITIKDILLKTLCYDTIELTIKAHAQINILRIMSQLTATKTIRFKN